jgi:hypothetical protein
MIKPTLVILTAVFFAGQAIAQDQAAPPLGGPAVKERKIPGVQSSFGGGAKPGKDGRGIPPEVLQKAIGTLDQEQTPADARLTDAQRDRIKELSDEFKDAVEAYRTEHRSEVEEVRRVLGRRGDRRERPKAKGPEGDQGMAPEPVSPEQADRIAAARAKLADLRANAPNPQDLQTRIWNELTESQRAIVQSELGKWMTEREQDKAREFVRQRLSKNGPGRGFPGDDQLPPKLRERLARLSPEERERALQRLRERLREEGARRRGSSQPPEPPPAPPPMDEVPVPPPGDGR